jgi:deazaflavin-dependent oxidoreductase (nitroreductase family)
MAVRELKKALTDTDEIQITVTGRRSGRKLSYPVWFVQEGETLYLLPVRGSDTHWYKNLLKTPTISISAGGKEWTAQATPITDAAQVRDVVERFKAKYGAPQVRRYYSKLDVAVVVPFA